MISSHATAGATAPNHPLDPLSPSEITAVVAIIKAHFSGTNISFNTVTLKEPPKAVMKPWLADPTSAFPDREAFFTILEAGKNGMHEGCVNLTKKTVYDTKFVTGYQPILTVEDLQATEDVVRVDPRVIEQCVISGVPREDMHKVYCDPWTIGYDERWGTDRRLQQALMYYRSDEDDSQYSHPLDFCPIVDTETKEVVFIDIPPVRRPLSKVKHANFNPKDIMATTGYRDTIKPINVTQPEGVSFKMTGNIMEWQNFKFHIGFNHREGIVLSDISYNEHGTVRPIFYRLSLAEMVVPYGCPDFPHQRKHAFDLGEYGAGYMTNPLALGCDCKGVIHYLDAHFADRKGDSITIKNAVCIHEEDDGVLFKHSDFRDGFATSIVTRGVKLIISQIFTAANYEYMVYWIFHLDGTIQLEVKLTGILNTFVMAPGEDIGGYGTQVYPNVNAHNHQHLFSLRINPNIDGEENSVAMVDAVQSELPVGHPGNKYGNGFLPKRTVFKTVSDSQNALSILTFPSLVPVIKHSQIPHFRSIAQTLPFCRPKSILSPLSFRLSFKSRRSPFSAEPQLSGADEEEEELENDEDDDDDDYEAADEYDEYEDFSSEVSDDVQQSEDEEEISMDSLNRQKEPTWQRVERLSNLVREFGEEMIDVDSLADIYDFRIDKFQRMAIEGVLRGSSVVVSAPTSSGKTLIAETAAMATVARGRRLLYTTPLKALSNQKFRQFRETFGDNNVGLLTGDSAVNKDAQVLVLTTEILRNMLYNSVGMASSGSGLFHVDVIVLDEVHYLSDISRGTVWEEIVIYCPKEVQLICLSATVANPDELAGWIGQIHGKTELVTSSWRPVPLTWHFSTKTSLLPLLNEKGTRMNRKLSLHYLQLPASGVKSYRDDGSRRRKCRDDGSRRSSQRRRRNGSLDSMVGMSEQPLSKNDKNMIRRSQVPQVVDTLWHLKAKDMLPAIWFIFNRRGCDAAVQYVEDCSLLDECEMSEVELALKRFRLQYPDAVRETAVKGLLRGVAAHHAGCLPLWKSFVEELFQRGLVKVVFATETLAAGINMPARTAVISSLSKRASTGRIQLSPNELLQMAGRAGRRGIDEKGHVVIVQTPYEGAEECCKLLFSGVEPLVSQFTASYGMVLNLLGGAKVTGRSNDSDETNTLQARRTLEEARKLVEQSFGNYLGSNVMLAAKEELAKTQKEIEALTDEITDDAIDRKSRKLLSDAAYKEIADLQEELRAEKRLRTEFRRRMELRRFSALKPLLKEFENGHLPFVCLQYKDSEGVENLVPAVYLGKVESLDGSKLKKMVSVDDSFALSSVGTELDAVDSNTHQDVEPTYHVALGSDNSWYLFTAKWIKTIYSSGFPNVALTHGEALPREIMKMLLDKEEMQWGKLADSDLGGLWYMEGSLETWSWSLNVPVLSSLSESDEMLHMSQEYIESVEQYKEQRNNVARLKKKIARTEGFREYKKILDMAKFTEEKIKRLKARSNHLINRMEQIEPSGWKEFLQISNVIHETRALDINTHVIYPLGETAAAIRGENELWLAMVLRNKILLELKPAQLAAVCASLVSEGIKVRAWKNNNYIYESSSTVLNVISLLDEQRNSFLQLQEKYGVEIPCCLDSQFSGMVEAWASGLSWRELMMDCAMDEGDLARLLRRTIDLLAQIPKLPDIDPLLQKHATTASDVMDRPPISELTG